MSDPVSAVFKMAERKRPFDHAMDLMMIVTMVSIPRPVEKPRFGLLTPCPYI